MEMGMRSISAIALAGSLLPATFAHAQTQTIDMAELKCGELTRVYLEQFVVIDAWLSGYYHAKSNKTVVDRKLAAENTQKVVKFCKANPTVTVMQAIEQLKAAGG
jgi:hypothetical protein